MNLLQKIEKEHCDKLTAECPLVNFKPGDTIRVFTTRIKQAVADKKGKKTDPISYTEKFEGVCLARTSRGMGSNFVVRKIVNNMAVEVMYPLYGTKVELIDQGVVRRSKLYYLSHLKGKKARIVKLRDHVAKNRRS